MQIVEAANSLEYGVNEPLVNDARDACRGLLSGRPPPAGALCGRLGWCRDGDAAWCVDGDRDYVRPAYSHLWLLLAQGLLMPTPLTKIADTVSGNVRAVYPAATIG